MSTTNFDRALIKSSAVGALLGTVLGAVGVAVWDGQSIFARDGGSMRSLLATLAAAFLLATTGALIATVITLIARSVIVLLERNRLDWSLVLGAIITASFTVLGAQAWVLVALSGAGIRTAVVALSAALGVGVSVALILALRALADRAGLQASLRARTVAFLAGSAATVVATVYFAPGLIDELDVDGLIAVTVPVAVGIAVALIGVERNRLVHVTAAAWLVLAACALAHVTTVAPTSTTRLVARRTHGARIVLNLFRTRRTLPALRPGSGTCRPGVKPAAVGRKPSEAAAGAPDIIVITSDSVRWDHTSLSGYERETTPNLKRWAKSAAVFSSAYTPGASTRQTFRALFTGLFPSLVMPSGSLTWWGVSLPAKQASLADRLTQAGYLTVSSTIARKGFDPNTGALKGFERMLPKIKLNGGSGKRNARQTRTQFDNILRELRKTRDKPVFTWAHLMVTHQPYDLDTQPQYGETEIDRYDWAIRFVDGELNRFLEELKADGRLDHTYVIFSADHGQAFYEHGNHLHGQTVYAEETNVPFVIWGPAVKPGVRAEPVSTLDMFPTILEVAGAPTAKDVCGSSLAPWLADPGNSSKRPVYMEQVPDERPTFAVGYINGRYKLVVTPRDGTAEVFDLKKDRRELNDLSDDQPELAEKLLKELAAHQKKRGIDPATYGLQ